MSVKRSVGKKKKKHVIYSRSLNTTFEHAPTEDFFDFKNFVRVEVKSKEYSKVIKSYMKKNFNKAKRDIILKCPEWKFYQYDHVASTVYWMSLEKEFPQKWDAQGVLKKYFSELYSHGSQVKENVDEDEPKKMSIQDIIKKKTDEFLSKLEVVIDEYDPYNHNSCMEYSCYDELLKVDAPYNMAKAVHDYYTGLNSELKELVEQKTSDLVEAYSHLKPLHRKKFYEFVDKIVTESMKYMDTKKVQRKITKPRVISATKQVQKVKYLKHCNETKITSINPESIIGATRLFTYNVHYKMLTEYVTDSPKGFSVKGTTLQGIDAEQSRQVKLRKPDEFLPIVLKKTSLQISKEWKNLTTKTKNGPNGRINSNTILLRVLDK